MLARSLSLLFALPLLLAGCGQPDLGAPEAGEAEAPNFEAASSCVAYLLDQPNFSGPLNPFPVTAPAGTCFNLPLTSSDRTSSFRLAGCIHVRFFDGANCTGASHNATTSGVMPPAFDNRTTSLVLN